MSTDREMIGRLRSAGRAFFGRFDSLREVQRQTIGPVYLGESVLVSSATASGKTEAVFAPLIARICARLPSVGEDVLVLAVAPTRALVNDLHARLNGPLMEIGWTCGRQTSDHQDKARRPHVLITTPESFDSMLVRDARWEHGNLAGHLLSKIEAVFIDEAHLFESSPRGDQLVWLLGRLRRLREHAHRDG
jgi:ATP-dependent Lhr-like helicase